LFSAFAPSTSYSGSSPILFELSRVLGGVAIDNSEPGVFVLPRPLYHYTLPFYGLLSLGHYLLSTRLVRPTRRWRIRRREAFLAVLALLALLVAVAVPFLVTYDRYEGNVQLGQPTPELLKPVPPIIGPVEPEVMIREAVIVKPTIEPQPTPTPASEVAP
jgi:hypothetical protein